MAISNAKRISSDNQRITVTTCAERKPNLSAQKLLGVIMLVYVVIAMAAGGDITLAIVFVPLAFAAIFSKDKIFDFDIFEKKKNKNIRTIR